MPGFGIQVIGADKLAAGLSRSPSTLAAEVRTAMVSGTTLIEAAARAKAPKKTGRLAGSITSRISGSGANLTGEVGPSVQYGLYQEYGTRYMRAQPFMAPALEQNVGRITQLFEQVGIKVVSRIVGGI